MKDFIPFDKEMIPERFEIDLAEETFEMEINYNTTGDFFTLDLYDGNGTPLVLGEKLRLGVPLWATINNPKLPAPTLIPLDESGNEIRITFENFNVKVFLYIDDGE